MANIKSQIKRNRQNEARHERNKAVRTRVRTAQRRFTEAFGAGDQDAARQAFDEATRELDRAATKGVIHANKAANRKSKMAKQLKAI